jgi:1-deoxy-D-xylulose-5-phosphate synthase
MIGAVTMSDPGSSRADKAHGAHLLERIHSPMDLRGLTPAERVELCAEIRAFLLDSVQRTGGHLGSNLGVVELTVALHTVFDFKKDRLVWDVSHQGYVHKLLTGRRERFGSMRQTDRPVRLHRSARIALRPVPHRTRGHLDQSRTGLALATRTRCRGRTSSA